jgi:hypothetical protein
VVVSFKNVCQVDRVFFRLNLVLFSPFRMLSRLFSHELLDDSLVVSDPSLFRGETTVCERVKKKISVQACFNFEGLTPNGPETHRKRHVSLNSVDINTDLFILANVNFAKSYFEYKHPNRVNYFLSNVESHEAFALFYLALKCAKCLKDVLAEQLLKVF